MEKLYQIRVSNLNWKATAEDIKVFLQTFAKVASVKLITDHIGRSKGFAYCDLEDQQSLDQALKVENRTHMERQIRIIKALPLSEKPPRENREPRENKVNDRKPREDQQERTQKPRGDRPQNRSGRPFVENRKASYQPRNNYDASIYVGNLSFHTSEMKLGRHFEKYGDIKNVRIIEDRETEKSKGFGYVEFDSKETVTKALQANNSDLDGRNIKVAVCQKKERDVKQQNYVKEHKN